MFFVSGMIFLSFSTTFARIRIKVSSLGRCFLHFSIFLLDDFLLSFSFLFCFHFFRRNIVLEYHCQSRMLPPVVWGSCSSGKSFHLVWANRFRLLNLTRSKFPENKQIGTCFMAAVNFGAKRPVADGSVSSNQYRSCPRGLIISHLRPKSLKDFRKTPKIGISGNIQNFRIIFRIFSFKGAREI